MTAQPRTQALAIVAQGVACATGLGTGALLAGVRDGVSPLVPLQGTQAPLATLVGRVPGLDEARLPAALSAWDCRATRLAWLGLHSDGFDVAARAARERYGAARVGLVLGTSASTIGASEQAYRSLAADGGFPAPLRSERLNTLHAVTAFVQQVLGLQGPCVTVSTACSSSAKAFAQAQRWLSLGLADAVVVAGVDALCDSVLFGFHALQLVAADRCTPFGASRRGINVGEAAAFALVMRSADRDAADSGLHLLGHGESNDAHHMSSPHPQGLGAEIALDAALARAGVAATDIGYLNLHGTATPRNDEVEAALVARRYASDVHASATKGLCGHTMGAAGLLEALICGLALREGVLSGTAGTADTAQVDPALGPAFAQQLALQPVQRRVRLAASHSFGFGGNNAVLVFGAEPT